MKKIALIGTNDCDPTWAVIDGDDNVIVTITDEVFDMFSSGNCDHYYLLHHGSVDDEYNFLSENNVDKEALIKQIKTGENTDNTPLPDWVVELLADKILEDGIDIACHKAYSRMRKWFEPSFSNFMWDVVSHFFCNVNTLETFLHNHGYDLKDLCL